MSAQTDYVAALNKWEADVARWAHAERMRVTNPQTADSGNNGGGNPPPPPPPPPVPPMPGE